MSDLEGGASQRHYDEHSAQRDVVHGTNHGSKGAGKLRVLLASVVVIGMVLTIVLGFSNGSNSPSNTNVTAGSNENAAFGSPATQASPIPLTNSNRGPSPTPPVPTTVYTANPTKNDVMYTPSPTDNVAMFYTASPTVDYTPTPTRITPTASPTPWAQTVAMPDTAVEFKGLSTVSRQTIQETYASCEDLYIDLYMAARLMGIEYIASESSYSYYFEDDSYGDDLYQSDDGIATTDRSGDAGDTTKVLDEPDKTESKPWGTNNQHPGVEEVDTVQSNGVQIFTLYGTEIVVVDAVNMTVLSRTSISDTASSSCYQSDIPGFLLLNESLVVFTTGYCYGSSSGDNSNDDFTSFSDGSTEYNTTVLVYDATTMTLRTNETLSGTYVSARAIGGNVYTVTSSSLGVTGLMNYLSVGYIMGLEDPSGTSTSGLNVSTYRTRALEQLDLRLDAFVQHVTRSFDCTSLQKLALLQNANDTIASSSLNRVVTISSIALTTVPLATVSTSMVLPDSLWSVYASEDYLIVAAVGSFYNSSSAYYASPQTYLLGYKLSEGSFTPTSVGTVPGSLLGQYSMDQVEKDGSNYLRVATTDAAQTTSSVTVLQLVDGSDEMMPVVGQVTGLGKEGERIYSVRFQGDRGFVVTFEYYDPFYTLDLSDPTNPLAMGELEVPGFSTYLHPVGDNLILGVGESVDEDFIPVNFLLSLFDVSNFSEPRLVHQWEEVINKTVSTTASSEVEYDTKAFRYLDDSNILIIPLKVDVYEKIPCTYTSYSYYDDNVYSDDRVSTSAPWSASDGSVGIGTKSPTKAPTKAPTMLPTSSPTTDIDVCWNTGNKTSDSFDGFRLFKIDATNGITEHFSVSHASGDYDSSSGCYGTGYVSSRSFVMEGVVVTMKGHSALSHNVTSGTQLATPLNLDEEVIDCSSNYYYYDDDRM